ncbi:MAG: hypothetical protein OHK93_004053 [Ramalina farinacea]|uniref:Uncharacterized protein n=1 Tax=Ramalina farinacea TaxID=258253 RepID=A0AA43TSC7_9LECA|nr:hypothetical protein [Ramalina farinacea]
MRVLSLLALLPSVVSTAAVQPNTNAISTQINSVPDQIANATGLSWVDPRLTIDPEAGAGAVNEISAYINALGLLSALAIKDFDSTLTSTLSASIAPWDDVKISIQRGQAPLPRRFAIWGLFRAIYYISKTAPTNSTIGLQYDGQPVGTILFRSVTRPNALDAAGSDSSTNITVAFPPEALPPEALPATQTTYKSNGKDLSLAGIYISLASALVQMAEKAATDLMFALTHGWPEFDTWIKITPEMRVDPPDMAVVDGISAVCQTANTIAERARYAEFTTLVIVQDMLVGRIDVEYGQGPAVQMPDPGVAGQVDTT